MTEDDAHGREPQARGHPGSEIVCCYLSWRACERFRGDLIDPSARVRIVKRTGYSSIIEFRSVVDAVRCAIEVQRATVERNAGVTSDKRIELRVRIHLGDVVEESDCVGDGVNIAARLEVSPSSAAINGNVGVLS